MRILTVLLLIACLFGAWRWWDGRAADAAFVATPSPNGFVPVHMPDGASRHAVLVLAPRNCPSDQAQRTEALVRHLDDKGIPFVRGDGIDFDIANPTAEQVAAVQRAVAVFRQGAPAVFIDGMAMSDPTPAQVVAEYRRLRAERRQGASVAGSS